MDTKLVTRGVRDIDLGNGEHLYFWYANKGRGSNNCTIIRSREPRSEYSKNQVGVIAKTTTSAWAGEVNFSCAVQKELGV